MCHVQSASQVLLSGAVYAALLWVWFQLQPTTIYGRIAIWLFLGLPLVATLVAVLIQLGEAGFRHGRARLAVFRARRAFRAALLAARRHPELVDVERLELAAKRLRRMSAAQVARLKEELLKASRHPYAPIRRAALGVLESVGTPTAPQAH